jgi:hypothetical protein
MIRFYLQLSENRQGAYVQSVFERVHGIGSRHVVQTALTRVIIGVVAEVSQYQVEGVRRHRTGCRQLMRVATVMAARVMAVRVVAARVVAARVVVTRVVVTRF